jgi:hypothetical protein
MTTERTVAGHRVLRLLAHGTRSQVWLAAGDVVLKVLTPPIAVDAAGHEAEALHRARGEHVVELLDVSLSADAAVLVFPRLPRGSLADLLARRRSLDAGEAVTILAPIATCLARVHGAGVAHGALTPDAVLFREDGAPMLTGFGRAELFEPGIPEIEREGLAGVVADRAALLVLADAVLARASGARSKAAARLRDDLHDVPPGLLAERMAAELFGLASARPLRFEADERPVPDPPGRAVKVAEIPVDEPETPVGTVQGLASRLLESGPAATVRAAVRERWAGWTAGRRRAVLASAAAGSVLLVALVVVPGPTVRVPAAVEAPQEAVPPTSSEVPDGGDDDPLVALHELVTRRDGCFRDLSVLCLDGVDEAGSSAWDADRMALQAILDGGDAPRSLSLTSATLVERLGDSALVDLGRDSDPASVLLLKGEAGWRIRDYLGAGGLGESGGD